SYGPEEADTVKSTARSLFRIGWVPGVAEGPVKVLDELLHKIFQDVVAQVSVELQLEDRPALGRVAHAEIKLSGLGELQGAYEQQLRAYIATRKEMSNPDVRVNGDTVLVRFEVNARPVFVPHPDYRDSTKGEPGETSVSSALPLDAPEAGG